MTISGRIAKNVSVERCNIVALVLAFVFKAGPRLPFSLLFAQLSRHNLLPAAIQSALPGYFDIWTDLAQFSPLVPHGRCRGSAE